MNLHNVLSIIFQFVHELEALAGGHLFSQGLTLIMGHDQEHLAVIGFPDFMDIAQVLMVQGGSGPGFVQKTPVGLLITGHLDGQELQSHGSFQPGILSPIYYPHAPLAQFFPDVVMRYGLSLHPDAPPDL
jgi:hypothetical protein